MTMQDLTGQPNPAQTPNKPKKTERFLPPPSFGTILKWVLEILGLLILVGYFVWQNWPTGSIFLKRQPTISAPANLGIGSSVVSPVDGMTLVYVPAGEFQMGSPASDGTAGADEKPIHTVYLDAYWIDQTEVTNAMYAKCVAARVCNPPRNTSTSTRSDYYGSSEFANYPVVYVYWPDAQAYCAWAGRKLPSEAEWEKAARGTDGRIYPWGDEPPNSDLLNYHWNLGDTTQVGSYPAGASPYGALDMAGNVWEWVYDWYGKDYYTASPHDNPGGPLSGNHHVIRGGSWSSIAWNLRSAMRYWIDPKGRTYVDYGFRCALNIAP
jgi:eukaryotic-like serine/threonine-protein kinase